ncbi:efflux transporter [Sparassis crispa]|uniref:Efflux transporter n=1 Tax=Sparassis crispa TaxID=139825 RepID=A0A401G9Q4_9APHY|nr:efflux transporter [Sparassis crispa]GBE78863.1 efflux transporter [Sparassis crispa]
MADISSTSSTTEDELPPPQNADTEKASATEPAHSPQRSMAQAIGLIATCTTAMVLNSSNSTAVAIALPTIGRDLNIPEYRLQWVVSAYSLSSGCLLLFLGRLADLHGRKLSFLFGAFVLGVFGLGCGFAQDEITLDVLRGFQGIGGAAVIPASLGMLAHAFPPSRIRSIAFATFAAGAPVGAAIGSIIGGVLTQLTEKTWRSVFYFMTGISALVFLGGLLTFDKDMPSTEQDKRVDWLGAFLVTAGLVMIVFVLSDGNIAPNGWKTSYIIALLIVGVLLLGVYVGWQYYLERVQDDPNAPRSWLTPPPLLRITLFSRGNGKLAAILAIAFLEYCGFMAFPFWLQLYYQDYIGLNPILTMVRLLPMFITGVLCNVAVALVVGFVPVVYLIVLGTTLTGVANVLFAVIDPAATYWAFGFPATVLIVFGADFVFPSGTLFVARVCLPHEQSVGGALFQTLTQLGGAFGLAITTIVYDATLKRVSLQDGVVINVNGTNAPAPAQLRAYKDAFFTASAFNFLGALLAIVFLRTAGVVGDSGKSGDGDPPEPEEKAPVRSESPSLVP